MNEPYGSATKPVVEKVALSPENFFNQVFVPFGRGANFTSNPETYKDVETFINDCDCRELIIPAENAVIYQNINGIHIPENHKINGQFPNVVKLIKEEQVEKLNLTLGEDNSLGCDVCVRGFWGHIRSRMTIEMACINIGIVHDNETTSFNLGFRYPHLTADAISDLLRLELWSSGSDLVFNRSNKKQAFVLNGFSDKTKNSDLKSFIDNNAKLYREIQVIENDLNDKLCIDKELTTEDIKHIHMASSSISPNHVKYTGTYTANAGKLTLKQLDIYNDSKNVAMIQMTCSDVLPEDCFQLLGKNIVLGIRRIRLIEPYIKNMEEAKRMVEENRDVVLEFASKKDEAILEYILPDDLNY
ncbi:hypothetical protein [Faecalispora jeddahensis]|uniref:hypothetical protein n=1 Tax=Faecalispora jeddahensis TaxID=1414721 RepID=UPI00145A8B16|nr:hypothetical protein [Faecalispora jeddahensis]